MPLDTQSTTLRQAPYYDDYDETKNFHRVLFKPSVAVQARELTQLQTILQAQIERFGDNVYQTGTIIKGCALTVDNQYYYVKLFDLQPSGESYNISALSNTYVVDSTTGLTALVVNYAQGGQQLDPDLNTIYVKYLNTGSGGQKAYSNNTVLTAYNRNYRVESIAVANGGSLYSNSDVVAFANSTGTGAVGQIITYANGTIRSVNVITNGSGYYTAPTVTVANSASGTGASLIAYNYIAQVQAANSTYTAQGTSTPIGVGSAIKTSDGIIYQKGNFIRVSAHEQILSKYGTSPSNVAVGFVTSEAVVNSNSDQTLLDNAGSTTNYTAPGADRLLLTPTLTVLSRTAAAANNEFLSLYEFEDGLVIKDRTTTQFNSVTSELSRRTYEESGNYVVRPFPMYSDAISGNTTHLNLSVGAGIAYVKGGRVELTNTTKYPIRKGTDSKVESTQTIATNYGGFVYVNEYMGVYDVITGDVVTLYNNSAAYGRRAISQGNGIGAPSGGAPIGQARVRSIVFDNGIQGTPSAVYRLYLFDIKMNAGYTFGSVRSVVYGTAAVSDVIWDTALGYATQYDAPNDSLLFSTGTYAVRNLDNELVITRTSIGGTGTKFTAGYPGNMSVTLSGGATLPYTSGSLLNSIQERDFVVIPSSNVIVSNTSSGNVSVTTGQTNVVGTNTKFTTEYSVGDYLRVGTTSAYELKLITTIASNTLMTVATAWTSTNTNSFHAPAWPASVPIDFSTSTSRTIQLTGDTGLTFSLGKQLASDTNATVFYDYKLTAPSVKAKTVNTYYTCISTTGVTNSLSGPWSLGVPDACKLVGVYVGTANGYASAVTGANRMAEFVLDSGQTDNYYGTSQLKRKPGSTFALSTTNCLVVVYKAFKTDAGSYVSTESYAGAIDDASTVLPSNRIRTQDIPVFTSPKNGSSVDLRNTIDFRPVVANTIPYCTDVATANNYPDPALEVTPKFGTSDKMFPSPTREFSATVNSYLGRRDRVIIDQYGQIRTIEGVPDNSPSVPVEPEGAMTIGVINVAPYPSLSAKDAADSGRPDYGVYINPDQNRRYTMKDISDIESRISRLEYYTLLNTLETTTKQLVLPSEANNSIERFKNGFFVDPLSDYNISNVQDPEYRVMIDPNQGIARPYFADVRVDLQYDSAASANVSQNGELLTLTYTEKELTSQPAATRDRTLVDQLWRYTGTVRTFPSFDNYFDIETSAVSIAVDIASPLNALAQATSAALSQLNVSTALLSTANVGGPKMTSSVWATNGNELQTFSQNIVKTMQDTKVGIAAGATTQTSNNLGHFVNDIALQQYIREQRIAFCTTGLRPGAQHHVFFDGALIDSRVTPAKVDLTLQAASQSDFVSIGAIGTTLTANSMGCVAGFIDIPGKTYFVGDRSVVVMDVDNVDSESTATSKSIGNFTAYTFTQKNTDLTLSTKTVATTGGSTFSAYNYLSEAYPVAGSYTWSREIARPSDPLSQTFLVQPQAESTDGIFITSIDVYFKQKDATAGVTLELRETTDSGGPAPTVIPFSRSYLPSASITTSNNASIATRFNMPSPVYVKANKSYALVLYPDANSPEYRIFTSVVGGRDILNTNLVSNQNWGQGTLYYSTSGTSWTAVQDEDLKFTINRAKFSATNGMAVLHNADHEFFTVSNTSGTFRGGETIAQLHPNTYITGTVTTATSNSIVATANNLTPVLAAGDDVILIFGTTRTTSTGNVSISGTTVTNATGVTTTNFTGEHPVGSFIQLGNTTAGEIRQVVAVANTTSMTLDAPISGTTTNIQQFYVNPTFQVAKILAANSTTLTLNKLPSVATAANVQIQLQKAVVGVVDSYNYSNNRVYINKSTAKSDAFKMYAANSTYLGLLIGDTSQATARVASIDNITANFFRPMFNSIVTPGTSMALNSTMTKATGGTDTSTYEMSMVNKLNFGDAAYIKSKSNEIVGTVLTKSFTANVGFTSYSTDISPILDITPTSIIVTRNQIDNYTSTTQLANTGVGVKTANTANGAPLQTGMGVRGQGIPTGTYITSISGNTITMSQASTQTLTNATLTFHSNETSRFGINTSKYISKRLTLADGMDAEDVKVYVTAYKPSGTSVDVYAKVLNYSDGDVFDNKDWTLLDQTTVSTLYSDSLNEEDYREFEYTFPRTPPATKITGFATVSNTTNTLASVVIFDTAGQFTCTSTANLFVGALVTISGTYGGTGSITGYTNPTTYRVSAVANTTAFTLQTTAGSAIVTTTGTPTGLTYSILPAVVGYDTSFTTALAVGDIVKVVRTSTTTDYDIVRVASIVNDTAFTTVSPLTFASSSCSIEKVDQPKAAFKYNRNSNIVRYHDAAGAPYDTYKYLAIKIVMRSPYTYLVPKLNDVRALAVSV